MVLGYNLTLLCILKQIRGRILRLFLKQGWESPSIGLNNCRYPGLGCSTVVKHLPSMQKSLGSILSARKNRKAWKVLIPTRAFSTFYHWRSLLPYICKQDPGFAGWQCGHLKPTCLFPVFVFEKQTVETVIKLEKYFRSYEDLENPVCLQILNVFLF